MSEDKMRYDFEEWASNNGAYPRAIERSGDGYKLAQTHQYWLAWKACAAIKDAEIAELETRLSGRTCFVPPEFQKRLNDSQAEIAARDLMINELLKDVEKIAFMGMDKPMQADGEYFYQSQLRNCIAIAAQALDKSEHHNSRALEKMLLEARIDELESWKDKAFYMSNRYHELTEKLAELNKE